ncbi:hypothetical protein [Clostridium estertheticum]|uniref:hypothetical protein n=1 Tax=Clostridium estertheticum TaxID=238834 RepID=UPI0014782798|nr:hypothetical protein [Clostridium estertheticum]MBZ9616776.1 hypothetical protein [Clostridium estertheticum subsp. laramiense]WAG72483.1 hypothetical protein LL032_15160 [Clostridium estertheticum]
MSKKIFKKKIAIELMVNDFNMVYTEPNRHKTGLTVFIFEDTEEFYKKLTEINDRDKNI